MSDSKTNTIDDFIKVGGSSSPQSVGSIIARSVVNGASPTIRAIGASAVNQATKACAIARGFVAPRGIDLSFIISFDDVAGDNGETISAICFRPVKR